MSLLSHREFFYPVYEGNTVRNVQHDAMCLLDTLRIYGVQCPVWEKGTGKVPKLMCDGGKTHVTLGMGGEVELSHFVAEAQRLATNIKEGRTNRRAAMRRIRQRTRRL